VPSLLDRRPVLLIAVCVAALVAPSGAHAQAPTTGAYGRIEGTVTISSALSSRRPRFRVYAEPGPGAIPPRSSEQDELRNVVLYLESSPALKRTSPDLLADGEAARPMAIRQADKRFSPHVLPVVRGSLIAFPNEDDVFHNVFSLSSTKTFDLGRYPRGSFKSVAVAKPGVVQVFCHIHSDMSAILLVLDNPFFATPGADGRFAIDSLPAGDYVIVGWHERIKAVSRTVRVVSGQTTRVDFNIPLSSADVRGGS
jgi:plastocyanin